MIDAGGASRAPGGSAAGALTAARGTHQKTTMVALNHHRGRELNGGVQPIVVRGVRRGYCFAKPLPSTKAKGFLARTLPAVGA